MLGPVCRLFATRSFRPSPGGSERKRQRTSGGCRSGWGGLGICGRGNVDLGERGWLRYRGYGPASVGGGFAYSTSCIDVLVCRWKILLYTLWEVNNWGLLVNCAPKNPLPPHTTSFLFAAAVEAIGAIVLHAELRRVMNCIQLAVGEE